MKVTIELEDMLKMVREGDLTINGIHDLIIEHCKYMEVRGYDATPLRDAATVIRDTVLVWPRPDFKG